MAYIQCETCSAKIPQAKKVEWGGKCPKCNGTSNYSAPSKSYVKLYKGFVKCKTEGCRTQIAANLIQENKEWEICPLCRGIKFQG